MNKKLTMLIGLLVLASMVIGACTPTAATPSPAAEEPQEQATTAPAEEEAQPTEAPAEEGEPTEAPTEEPVEETTRVGGWLDEVNMSVISSDSAITQIQAGAVDIYANGLSSSDLPALEDSGLPYASQNGLYYELTLNPVGPTFPGTGKLNPFSSAKVREALNWLMDRNYLNQEIYEGGALPRYLPVVTQFPTYSDVADTARALEAKYAYNPELAEEVITEEMEAMGAELVDGQWQFEGEPVTIILLIRSDSDGTRVPIGDYVGNQLESIGFTVDRQYKTASEASPLWVGGNPADGLWHVYTGAWSATVIDRDEGDNFQFFYDPSSAYGFSALWQAYTPVPEYADLIQKLAYNQFTSIDERNEAMARALELAMEDSVRIWLIDGKGFIPYNENVQATADLAAGVEGAAIWPYTLRLADQEGGSIAWATQDLFGDPWNPLAGSNWAFDQGAIRGTISGAVLPDPFTGLYHPLNLESAQIVAEEGLPIASSLDWMEVTFEPTIEVPEDAWVDWDATNQVWITAGEKFPDGATAKVKVVTTYPADLFERVKWHDGSPLSVGDFVMYMIMNFDPAKPESAIYDEALAANLDAFLATFKGFKIVSTDPLSFEYYTDAYQLDAEVMTGGTNTPLWPNYVYGEGKWDMMAVANLAEADGQVAYTADKADANSIEWTNFVGGPSLEILAGALEQATSESLIPYAPTMSEYVTAEEAAARYEALQNWYDEHGHFWVGTGPYYLDQVFTTEKTLTLRHFDEYPDLASRWAGYDEPKLATVELDGPGQVVVGEEAVYDVFVTFNDEPYANADVKGVKALLSDATGAIVWVGQAEPVSDGQYSVTIPADVSANLEAGSNKLEVAVIPSVVSVPTFTSIEFITVP